MSAWSPEALQRSQTRRMLRRLDLSIPGLDTVVHHRAHVALAMLDAAVTNALHVLGEECGGDTAFANGAVVAFAIYRVPIEAHLDAIADAVRLWITTGGEMHR